ncbi:MAG: two-component sensor histidine kinase, partial [Paracoccaceae bacterium]|nr:two-component sensor histidine kinase [Paracoccaceae bacterium]
MFAGQGTSGNRLHLVLFALAGIWVLALAGTLAYSRATNLFLADTARRGDSTLQLAVSSLRGQMARFERLPHLIADHALITSLARSPQDPVLVARTNDYLRQTQRLLGASDIYFMDMAGITRAASNHDTETSFIGGNFAFRPYFFDALRKGAGRFYALGTTSRKRGYYFGAPVLVAGAARGVLVFKVDLDAIEQAWRGGDYEVLVTDPEGIIFLSSRQDWLFAAIAPLTPDQRARLDETRRYADTPLQDFPLTGREVRDGHRLMTVADGPATRDYMALDQPMPEADWTISVLLDTASAKRQALTVAVVVMLGLGLGAMALAVVLQRRAQLRERLNMQGVAQTELERRVKDRTRQLAALNQMLEAEVTERRTVEQNLLQAQSDLVQAGKLAALGQMSAALSHEFNQ